MRIYYDTEFTEISSDAQLISAGFVSEKGAEFYVEFDNVPRHACSDFVRETVLPMLRAPGVLVVSPVMGLSHLLEWLQAQGPAVTLVSDSHYDSKLLGQLIREAGGLAELAPGLEIRYELLYHRDSLAERAYKQAEADYFLRNPHMRHHALHDARAIRLGAMRADGFY